MWKTFEFRTSHHITFIMERRMCSGIRKGKADSGFRPRLLRCFAVAHFPKEIGIAFKLSYTISGDQWHSVSSGFFADPRRQRQHHAACPRLSCQHSFRYCRAGVVPVRTAFGNYIFPPVVEVRRRCAWGNKCLQEGIQQESQCMFEVLSNVFSR